MNATEHIFDDKQGMNLALEWAKKGLFITSPNPRVGCVIVKNNDVIGAGHTQAVGQAHAEVQALLDAKTRGQNVRGATVYVTLEPCSHYGRTPPCALALIEAGIARAVIAIKDPFPDVAGKGIALLLEAGIEITLGVLEHEAREMNIGFFSRFERGLPWVRMKSAASLDGKTGLHNGQSQWITAEPARNDGHAWRARACAILTGIGTVQADDPQLTVRAVATPRQPQRIVVDRHLDISPEAKVLSGGGTWIITANACPDKSALLSRHGAEVIYLANENGDVDLPALMRELAKRDINELHIEAGARLNGALLQQGCVDELLLYLAPNLIGDAQTMFALPTLDRLEDKIPMRFHEITPLGEDVRIIARINTH